MKMMRIIRKLAEIPIALIMIVGLLCLSLACKLEDFFNPMVLEYDDEPDPE